MTDHQFRQSNTDNANGSIRATFCAVIILHFMHVDQ